jgi:hypothetical protein
MREGKEHNGLHKVALALAVVEDGLLTYDNNSTMWTADSAGAKAWCLPYIHIPSFSFSPHDDGPLAPSAFHGWKILGFVMMAQQIWRLLRAIQMERSAGLRTETTDVTNNIKYRHKVLYISVPKYI